MLSFFPRDALDEICDLIESVSEGFPTYSVLYPRSSRLSEFEEEIDKTDSIKIPIANTAGYCPTCS